MVAFGFLFFNIKMCNNYKYTEKRQTYDMKQKRYREAVLNALIDFEFLPSKIGYRIFDFSMETGISVSNKNDAIDEILDRF